MQWLKSISRIKIQNLNIHLDFTKEFYSVKLAQLAADYTDCISAKK